MIQPSRRRRASRPTEAQAFGLHRRIAAKRRWHRRLLRGSLASLLASLVAAAAGLPPAHQAVALAAALLVGAAVPVRGEQRRALAYIRERAGLAYETSLELTPGADPFGFTAAVRARAVDSVRDVRAPDTPAWWLPFLAAALALLLVPLTAGPALPGARPGAATPNPGVPAQDGAGGATPRAAPPRAPTNAPQAPSAAAPGSDQTGQSASADEQQLLSRYLQSLQAGSQSGAAGGSAPGAAPGAGAGEGGAAGAAPGTATRPGAGGSRGNAPLAAGQAPPAGATAGSGAAPPDSSTATGQSSGGAGQAPASPAPDGGASSGAAGQRTGTGSAAGGADTRSPPAGESEPAGGGTPSQQGNQSSAAQGGVPGTSSQTGGSAPPGALGDQPRLGGGQGDAQGGANGPAGGTPGPAQPPGGQDGAGAGPGGRVPASPAAPGAPAAGPGLPPQFLPGDVRAGPQAGGGTVLLPGASSVSLPPGTNLERYRRAAEQALTEGDIPLEYQNVIRNYFR